MACPNCKHERIRTIDGAEWYFSCEEDQNTNDGLIFKYCPYCGCSLNVKKEPKCWACLDRQGWYCMETGVWIGCTACVPANICMHCLESGYWRDEDKCPSCESLGHTSPWAVGGCEACNKDFFAHMKKISDKHA